MWLRMGVGRMRIDGQPRDMITTVLDGLTQLTADDCEVVYSRGANVIDLVPDPAASSIRTASLARKSAFPPPLIKQ